MSSLVRHALLVITMGAALVAATPAGAARYSTAPVGGVAAPSLSSYRTVAPSQQTAITAITATAPLPQVLTSASGLTVVRLPLQVVSGGRLVVRVHTLPGARVTLEIGFSDGERIVKRGRAGRGGNAYFAPLITYQPQASTDTLTVAVHALQQATTLNDVVPGTVTVLQRIVLSGRLVLPHSIAAGQILPITVVANMPNVSVGLTLRYPDGQAQPLPGCTTDPTTDSCASSAPVSTSDGVHGVLRVRALLSYQGVDRAIGAVVVLRPRQHATGAYIRGRSRS